MRDSTLRVGPVLVGIAVWSADVDPHPGSKSVTTWHPLALE